MIGERSGGALARLRSRSRLRPRPAVGESRQHPQRRQRRQRALHHVFHTAGWALQGVHHTAVSALSAAQAGVFLFPEAAGAVHDAVDDVAVHRIETRQCLPARPVVQHVGGGATGRRAHFSQLVPRGGGHVPTTPDRSPSAGRRSFTHRIWRSLRVSPSLHAYSWLKTRLPRRVDLTSGRAA